MKKSLFILIVLVGFVSQLKAQEANKFRFDVRLGYATPTNSGGDGILFNLEPKWTITDQMNVGIKLGIAVYGTGLGETTQDLDETVGANVSYSATYDYYFNNKNSTFVPFIGGGLGYYQVANVEINDADLQQNTLIEPSGKFGGMIRAGFDWAKFRMAAEYNLIGESDLRDVNNNIIGTSKNGYIGISIGAYFGGGKWGK